MKAVAMQIVIKNDSVILDCVELDIFASPWM